MSGDGSVITDTLELTEWNEPGWQYASKEISIQLAVAANEMRKTNVEVARMLFPPDFSCDVSVVEKVLVRRPIGVVLALNFCTANTSMPKER